MFTFNHDADGNGATPATYALYAAFSVVAAYVTNFFNAALISQAHVAPKKGDPTVAGGSRTAGSMAGRLLPWALLTATVSMIIRAAKERLGFLGRLIGGLAGMAWNLVTYLVLPVMVLEGATTKPAVKRSATLFRDTWGENVLGNVGIGVISVLMVVPSFLLIVLGAVAGGVLALVLLGIAMLWSSASSS